MQRFTFNRPITLLFSLSLLLIMVMCGYGLSIEFRLSLVFMLLATGTVVATLFYVGFLRKMEIGEGRAAWFTPKKRYEMDLADVKYFGTVKFRSFRFIYISSADEKPFQLADQHVVSDASTFVIQYRPRAWEAVQAAIAGIHPDLKPDFLTRA
jgi:hypothetical protein